MKTLKTLVFFIIISFLNIFVNTKTTTVDCPVQWVPHSSHFNYSLGYHCSPGLEEYVGKVFHQNTWIPARIDLLVGKAFIPVDGQVLQFDAYQVLQVPSFCLLSWEKGQSGSIPDHAVAADTSSTPPLYIGRSSFLMQTYCGSVDPNNGQIFLPTSENVVETSKSYDVLVSVYPTLSIELSNFEFDWTIINKANSIIEIIDQEDIMIPGFGAAANRLEVFQTISHSKMIEERFEFSDVFEWIGISKVQMSFPLFYGTDDFEYEVNGFDEEDGFLYVENDRLIRVDSIYNFPAVSATRSIELCSLVTVAQNVLIPFTAEAVYRGNLLKADQLADVLTVLGRNFVAPINGDAKSVSGLFEGQLIGRFAIHSSFYVGAPNPDWICSGYT